MDDSCPNFELQQEIYLTVVTYDTSDGDNRDDDTDEASSMKVAYKSNKGFDSTAVGQALLFVGCGCRILRADCKLDG
jgi:hypothetical protein